MAGLKTKANDSSVEDFIATLTDDTQRTDSHKLIVIMSSVSGESPTMWGGSIIGFGSMPLKYASGRELDWLRIGFSPRKGKLSLYLTMDAEKLTAQYKNLGEYKIGKGCIYIKTLADIDIDELIKLIETAYRNTYAQ